MDDADRIPLLAWQSSLPAAAAFTHLTAARARGWWLPPLPENLPVFVTITQAVPRPRRTGLNVARHREAPAHAVVDGLRLADPTEVLLACARDLSLLDLIVVVDAALHLDHVTVDRLNEAAARRRRGAPLLRRAIALSDPRSESAWETLLRILHVTCDVKVTPQFEVLDEHGAFVARGDLRLDGTPMLHEYDGGEHRTAKQQAKDLRRDRRLNNAGWLRRGYSAPDVLTQSIGILRDADAAIGREHDPSRIREWHRLVRESCFSPAGLTVFSQRLGLAPGSGHSATA